MLYIKDIRIDEKVNTYLKYFKMKKYCNQL
jgi:hypothetical protein